MTFDPYRVKKMWITFSDRCLSENVHPIQFSEMRRAFYSGVLATLTELLQIVDEEDKKGGTEEESICSAQGMYDECTKFFEEVAEGKK